MSLFTVNSPLHASCSSELVAKPRRRRRNIAKAPKSSLFSLATPEQISPSLPTPRLAATSTEFQLGAFATPNGFPSPSLAERSSMSRCQNDLIRLRSNAFCELHRSVAESGEVLVCRMRDYETSRARSQVLNKARDAQKRDRKRFTPGAVRCPVSVHVSDTSNDEDIQFCSIHNSEELSEHSAYQQPLRQRSELNRAVKFRSCYSCNNHITNNIQQEGNSISIDHAVRIPHEYLPPPSSALYTPTPPSSSHSLNSQTQYLSNHIANPDKEVAALSLALASGACGLNDYIDIRRVCPESENQELENTRIGEMWH